MVFRFEGYELDIARYSLRNAGGTVSIEPRVLEFLHYLVSNRHRLVSKSELLDELWTEDFVSDGVLTRCVYLARLALGDSSDRQHFIKTVRGRGYQFSDDVSVEVIREPLPETQASRTRTRSRQPSPDHLFPFSRFEIAIGDRRFALQPGKTIIGRAPDATIKIVASGVSRKHARITVVEDSAVLQDLGSKNGTFLHGRKTVAPMKLADGDTIRVGRAVLVFRVVSSMESTMTQSEYDPS